MIICTSCSPNFKRFAVRGAFFVMMTITINGKEAEVADSLTLAELVATQKLPERGVAVAVDNKLVQRNVWQSTMLHQNAKVVIIKAACGG